MAKTKKGLSLVLAVVMLFSMLAVGTFAAGAENAAFTVSTDAAGALKAGDTVTVTVSLTTDYFVGPLAVPVTYDATAFDLVANSLTVSKIFGDATTDTVTSTQDGSVYVVISPKTSGTPTTAIANNLTLFTFQLTAADVNGEFPIAITDNQKTAANPGGKWYCGSFDSADPKTAKLTTVGQTFTKTDASVTIGSAMQPADLALTDKGTTAGVVIDTNKTFGGQYAGVVYGFTQAAANTFKNNKYITANCQATNGGSLSIKASDGKTTANGNYGTGTTITVLNSDDSETGKVYVVVIFGDIDGNGLINLADTASVKSISSNASLAPNNTVKRFAANCALAANANLMHIVNLADTTAVKKYVGGTKFDTAALAARHAQYNNFYQ